MIDQGSGPAIRYFQPEDQQIVRRLILDGLGEHFEQIDESLNPDLDDINASYLNKGHQFVVAELANQIVGAGALLALRNQTGRIVRVSVAKNWRRQGIGEAIVARLIELAQTQGFVRLLVETNHDWLAAIELYYRCGFEPYERDTVSIHMRLELN